MVFLTLVKIGCVLFLAWLFRDMRGLVIIGLLFGGIALFFLAGYIYYGSIKLISIVCPKPKPGMLVFATLYYLNELSIFISAFTRNDEIAEISAVAVPALICAAIAFFAFREAWNTKD